MRRWIGVVLLTIFFGLPGRSYADFLFFSGNFNGDGLDSLNNQVGGLGNGFSAVFEKFTAGTTWNITDVYSQNLMSTGNVSSAYWGIFQIFGDNNYQIVAGNTSAAATATATGNTYQDLTEYKVKVNVNVTLGAGTYYLYVSPILSGDDQAYISATSGGGGVGSPLGNNADSFYYSNPLFGSNVINTTEVLGPNPDNPNGTWGFSEGIDGSPAASAAPEPSSVALVGLGLTCLAGRMVVSVRSRRRKAVA
jgi:hypothetical protein